MVPFRLRSLVAVLVLLLGAAGPVAPVQAQSTTVFRGGQLFDTAERAVRPNPGLVVRAGKIVARGRSGIDTTGARTVRLDSTQVLLPGFIDLHAHSAVDFFGEGRVEETEGDPLLYLANGATTTFTAGELQPEKMRRGAPRRCAGGGRAGERGGGGGVPAGPRVARRPL